MTSHNFVTLVDRESVDAKCIVMDKGKRYEFDRFVTIGFMNDADSKEEIAIVAAYLTDLGSAIDTLIDVFRRGMTSASPEVRAKVSEHLNREDKGENTRG